MSFEGALPFLGIRNPTPAVALNRATEDGFYKPMWMLADSKLFGDIHWSLSLFLAGHIRSVRPLATWALALNFCR
jgi:hypothetical protein